MKHDLPLQGKKVLVTRNKAQAQSFREKVGGFGRRSCFNVIDFVSARPSARGSPGFQADLESADWLVFTSVNGAKFFFSYLKGPLGPVLLRVRGEGCCSR